jgi:hypothetical protein
VENRYWEAMEGFQKVKNAGYPFVSTGGCEFEKLLHYTPGIENKLFSHSYVKNHQNNIRDASYGGRTESSKSHFRVMLGKEVRYVDIISLYPYVCKYVQFLVGHSEVKSRLSP